MPIARNSRFNLNGERNGERLSPRFALQQERIRIAAMTPEQRAAMQVQAAQAAIFKARQKENSFIYRAANTGWSAVAPGPLSPIGKEFQQIVLARDWDALFTFLPLKYWGRYDVLGKYSFKDINGVRTWIPFSSGDISSFVYSPYYSVQPGYTCSDAQRELGVNANIKGMSRHGQKFRKTDPRVIWPILPGWGYGGEQRYGCEKQKKSTWVKIRKGVAIAGAIVGAVFLGPIIVAKAGSLFSGAATSGAAGAAGAAGTAAGTAGAVSTVTQATFLAKVASGTTGLLKYVNNARTIKAVVEGKMPPPPIELSGAAFRSYAFEVAQDELVKEFQRRLTEKEENKLRAEIAEMQRQLIAATPPEVLRMSPEPDPGLAEPLKKIQVIEKQRQADMNKYILPGAIIAGALILGV